MAWPNPREKEALDNAELPVDKLKVAAELGAKYADVVCTCVKDGAEVCAPL